VPRRAWTPNASSLPIRIRFTGTLARPAVRGDGSADLGIVPKTLLVLVIDHIFRFAHRNVGAAIAQCNGWIGILSLAQHFDNGISQQLIRKAR
jgi:hypothetical protein